MNFRSIVLSSMALGAVAVGLSAPANAALIGCPLSFTADGTAKVMGGATTNSAASACQYIDPPDQSNVANEANVNAAGFFGLSTWQFAPEGAKQLDVGATEGDWLIPSPDFANYDYMLTFKDGKGTNLISFLMNEQYTSGSWTSPFTNPPFGGLDTDQVKEVSHFSLFRAARTTTTEVPEPGSLALLSLGLLGLGVGTMRRRRR